MAYGKIWESLYSGSLVGSGLNVFAVWSYAIANAKPPGLVELNPVIMAAIFGCTKDDVLAAIHYLCSPDPNSRTPDEDGRRLVPEGSYLYRVTTWAKYNQMRNEIARRESNREAQKRWREKHRNAYAADGEKSKPMEMQMQMEMQMEKSSSSSGTRSVPEQSSEGSRTPVVRDLVDGLARKVRP